ncbi:MAG: hypothetical protein Q8M17_16680 [Actinomycetota bacterium]|nr:hypothetical protein [Actinomycetota bacterium]
MPLRPEPAVVDARVLTVGPMAVVVDAAVGGRIARWEAGGLSLLAAYGDDPVEYGMYPMAPWAGRLRDNTVISEADAVVLPVTYEAWALHGLVLSGPLEVVEHRQSDASATLLLRRSGFPDWPWPMTVELRYLLEGTTLTTTITVIASVMPFPAVVGWHPWFRRDLGVGERLVWDADATEVAVRGADYLPTGERVPFSTAYGPFDDALVVPDGRMRLTWPGALAVDVQSDGSWFVVFDQLPMATCIEPQSGPPNGVNDGLGAPVPMAVPGRPHTQVTRWTVRDLREGRG